jgi:uncharacterized protein YbaR (Trm112 family)
LHIEMIDLLRCPREHEETWLVAAFKKMDGRFVVEGTLGCPICRASYDITDGAARFGGEVSDAFAPNVSAESVMRTAALLNMMQPGSVAVLCGTEANAAEDLSELTQSRVIALNPASKIEDTESVATIVTLDRIPLGSSSIDGIAIGDCHSLIGDSARVLKAGARIVAAATIDFPPGFREIARDDLSVVAESVGPLVGLKRSS